MTHPLKALRVDGCTLTLWSKAGYEVQDVSDEDVVGFAFEAQSGVDAIGSDKKRAFSRPANTLSWIPRECPVYSCSKEGGEYLVIRNLAGASLAYPRAAERPLNAIVDVDAVKAAYLLRRMVISGQGGDALVTALDTLGATLHHHCHDVTPTTPWISDRRLAATDRFIDRHLHESLTIDRLASELALSVGFLVRAFRQSLGMTPHRYIMERRLAHARRLLTGNTPIATVAFECGFTDQAHLTRIMRQTIGVTPSRYRQTCGKRGSSGSPPI
ncbi:AraC family transcriptional regulator [Robbsia sp. KACC 23696]|uniref:AraC family transcriptional regulator n=1 Tax=Robbsia sp. KACC 23696 TaxID=3149231 RepID=UPI00325AA586